jgi:hypothetical protein
LSIALRRLYCFSFSLWYLRHSRNSTFYESSHWISASGPSTSSVRTETGQSQAPDSLIELLPGLKWHEQRCPGRRSCRPPARSAARSREKAPARCPYSAERVNGQSAKRDNRYRLRHVAPKAAIRWRDSRILHRLPIGEILKIVESESVQELDRRDIGVGSPCPRTFRTVCNDTKGAQISEHIAADFAAKQIARLPARRCLKMRDRGENDCLELGKIKRSILDTGRELYCVGIVSSFGLLVRASAARRIVGSKIFVARSGTGCGQRSRWARTNPPVPGIRRRD